VKIPAGINEGMRIRSAGNGEPGTNGGPPGDLYIEIRIKAARHLRARRRRPALHGAGGPDHRALGGAIEVPTLGGKAEIELPEGTQHGKTFRLRGKGIKGCAPATRATCTATSRWRRRSSSPSTSASC
jgi:molecular chaperone DnaJ